MNKLYSVLTSIVMLWSISAKSQLDFSFKCENSKVKPTVSFVDPLTPTPGFVVPVDISSFNLEWKVEKGVKAVAEIPATYNAFRLIALPGECIEWPCPPYVEYWSYEITHHNVNVTVKEKGECVSYLTDVDLYLTVSVTVPLEAVDLDGFVLVHGNQVVNDFVFPVTLSKHK